MELACSVQFEFDRPVNYGMRGTSLALDGKYFCPNVLLLFAVLLRSPSLTEVNLH